jgi:hypothetical protein
VAGFDELFQCLHASAGDLTTRIQATWTRPRVALIAVESSDAKNACRCFNSWQALRGSVGALGFKTDAGATPFQVRRLAPTCATVEVDEPSYGLFILLSDVWVLASYSAHCSQNEAYCLSIRLATLYFMLSVPAYSYMKIVIQLTSFDSSNRQLCSS